MAKKKTNFYKDLTLFLIDWMAKENKKGRKPLASEIIGGLEMVKIDFFWTQNWFIDNTIKKHLKGHMIKIIDSLKDRDITIDSNGGVTIVKK